MSSITRIRQLAATISRDTEVVERYLKANDIPTPSLEVDALCSIPISDDAVDVKRARTAVIEACLELKDLMSGPKELLQFQYTTYTPILTRIGATLARPLCASGFARYHRISTVLRFKLDKSFPVGTSTSFQAMSDFSGFSVMNVKRIVRHASLNHRFVQEKSPGIITHSALTAVLAQDPSARNASVVKLDEFWPAGVKVADALARWPNSEECNQAGFSLATNSDKGMYEIFADNPERGERFGFADNEHLIVKQLIPSSEPIP